MTQSIPPGNRAERSYQICARCVMDTSDPEITFDEHGVCNHCSQYSVLMRQLVWPPERSRTDLPKLVEQIKAAGRGKDYDCVIGVSGGVDSTYVAYKVSELGLRALAVHMDNGWNSTLAVTNINKALTKLGIDLYTEVLDWEEFKDIQLAILRASTPDSEIPSDHAIKAVLMEVARKHRIKYIIGGGNVRTEAILPRSWSRGVGDWKYIQSTHKQFGTVPIKTFPHYTLMDDVLSQTVWGIRWIRLLNLIDYNKTTAMEILKRELGWQYYGGKHHESVYTRFFQSYILPIKFGADKRRAHLSCQINNGEITREQALKVLEEPICDPDLLAQDKEFVVKKLCISEEEFDRIMALPRKTINDYPAYENGVILQVLRLFYRLPRKLQR